MAKLDNDRQNIEDITTDKVLEEIQKQKKQMKTSSALAFAALIAIIALCIAWFASNNQVTANTSGISADDDNPFLLASIGSRQEAEKNYLKNENGEILLSEGTSRTYDHYIDVEIGKTVSSENETYYTGISGLAWHMNGQQSFSPGGSGKLEFYVIPKMNNLKSVTITLNMTGYYENSNRAEKKENKNLQDLISGHILLFQNLDDTYGYTGWLGKDSTGKNNTLKVNAPKVEGAETATFKKDVPYKITIYWVWPRYFRNYIYTQRSTQEDLFTDKIDQSANSEYQEFINFINSYKYINSEKNAGNGKFFFSTGETGQIDQFNGRIDNQMSDTILDECSKYYNQADEYIGNNLKYIYVEMKVE